MQLKITTYLALLASLVAPLNARPLPCSRECHECEKELWEEVGCDEMPSTITSETWKTTTAIPKSTQRERNKYAAKVHTTSATLTHSQPTTISPEFATPKDVYKKCYFDCKLGCKEFCRRVANSPYDKQIVQVSKIAEPSKKGRIQSTHILQRKLIPKAEEANSDNSDDYVPSDHSKLTVASIEPVFGPYAAEEYFRSQLPSRNPSISNQYDFQVPLERVFAKAAKAFGSPDGGIASSLLSSPSSPTPVNEALLRADTNLEHLDDSVESLIREFIGSNAPSRERATPFFSVLHNRL